MTRAPGAATAVPSGCSRCCVAPALRRRLCGTSHASCWESGEAAEGVRSPQRSRVLKHASLPARPPRQRGPSWSAYLPTAAPSPSPPRCRRPGASALPNCHEAAARLLGDRALCNRSLSPSANATCLPSAGDVAFWISFLGKCG